MSSCIGCKRKALEEFMPNLLRVRRNLRRSLKRVRRLKHIYGDPRTRQAMAFTETALDALAKALRNMALSDLDAVIGNYLRELIVQELEEIPYDNTPVHVRKDGKVVKRVNENQGRNNVS